MNLTKRYNYDHHHPKNNSYKFTSCEKKEMIPSKLSIFTSSKLQTPMIILLSSILTACGGGSGGETYSGENDKSLKAIVKIVEYAENDFPEPVVEDYVDIGIVGVSQKNIKNVNERIRKRKRHDVDTRNEIQAVVDSPVSTDTGTSAPVLTDTGISAPVSTDTGVNTPASTDAELNNKPVASQVTILGSGDVGSTLALDFVYEDSDGDAEGNSIVSWTTSTIELQRGTNKTFKIPNGTEGETIYTYIHPVDEHGAKGSSVRSDNGVIVKGSTPVSNTEPTTTTNNPSTVTNSSTAPYEDLLAHRVGFAGDVTGGAGGDVVVISSLTDSSLKDALESRDPKWVRFTPGLVGTYRYPQKRIAIENNKTIDGRGADITFSNSFAGDVYDGKPKDFNFTGKTNIIFHNVTFKDIGIQNDPSAGGQNVARGISMYAINSTKIWVDHVTFSRIWDDGIGFSRSEATISWSKWDDQAKAVYIDGSAGKTTLHHNLFDGSTVSSWPDSINSMQRIPLFRDGELHAYNNYITEWGYTGASTRLGGEAVFENNVFGASNGSPAIKSKDGYGCQHGNTLEVANVSMTGVWSGTLSKGEAFDCSKVFTVQYPYAPDLANNTLKQKIHSQAGRSDNPQW